MAVAGAAQLGAAQLPAVALRAATVDEDEAAQAAVLEVVSEGITCARAGARSIATIRIEAVVEAPFDEVAFADGAHVNIVDGSPVVARFIHPFNRFAPCAHASAVHHSNLAEVVFAFDERSIVRLVGRELAERPHSVVVEDRHTVDAGAHHLIIFEVTLVTALGTAGQFNIVNIQIEHVAAVEVTDGKVSLLAGIGAQVNAVVVPVALCTLAARTIVTLALGSQRPFVQHGEVAGIGASGGDGHAEVFSGITAVLSASPEAEGGTAADG